MIPCKQLLEFDLEMVSNFSENANILEYEIKFDKNLKACDWSVWKGCRVIACFGASLRAPSGCRPRGPRTGPGAADKESLVLKKIIPPPPRRGRGGWRGVAGVAGRTRKRHVKIR